MAGLVPAIHVFLAAAPLRRGCPGQARARRVSPLAPILLPADSHGEVERELFCRPIRPGFVLQLEEHRQRKTVDHFRFVERDKFRLVQDRVNQRAEHHLKREANAPRLRRDPAPAHPRQQ